MIQAVLLAVAIAATVALWRWQVPGRSLTPGQIQQYLAKLERQLPLAPSQAERFLSGIEQFAARDDGRPFYMLNLMRFRNELAPIAGLQAHVTTPSQANAYYEQHVIPLALKVGAYPVAAGMSPEPPALPGPAEAEGWDRIIMMRYPSRRAFLELLADPVYANFMGYKLSSVELGLIPVSAQAGFPDMRWVACAFTAGLGLAALVGLVI